MFGTEYVLPTILKFRSRRRRNLNILQARAALPPSVPLAPSFPVLARPLATVVVTPSVSYDDSALAILRLALPPVCTDKPGGNDA